MAKKSGLSRAAGQLTDLLAKHIAHLPANERTLRFEAFEKVVRRVRARAKFDGPPQAPQSPRVRPKRG